MILSYDQQVAVFLDGKVALFIAIITEGAIFCFIGVGEIVEIEPLLQKCFPADPRFSIGIQEGQYSPVLPDGIVDVAHEVYYLAVDTVVESAAALVGTEFLVRPALDGVTAFGAGLNFDQFLQGA